MNLPKKVALGFTVAITSLVVNSTVSTAATLNTNSTTPVAIPAECGDAGTSAQYVTAQNFPLLATVDQNFVYPQTGTAGVLIIQPGPGVDTAALHTQLPLPQGTYSQTFTTTTSSASTSLLVYVAYTFTDSFGRQIAAVSRVPASAISGAGQFSNHSLKGKSGTFFTVSVNTNLASLNNLGLTNLAFNVNPDAGSTNFQLLGIAALIADNSAPTAASVYFNDFQLNGTSVVKDTVDNLSCNSFLTLVH